MVVVIVAGRVVAAAVGAGSSRGTFGGGERVQPPRPCMCIGSGSNRILGSSGGRGRWAGLSLCGGGRWGKGGGVGGGAWQPRTYAFHFDLMFAHFLQQSWVWACSLAPFRQNIILAA